jgi:hypothetical protein
MEVRTKFVLGGRRAPPTQGGCAAGQGRMLHRPGADTGFGPAPRMCKTNHWMPWRSCRSGLVSPEATNSPLDHRGVHPLGIWSRRSTSIPQRMIGEASVGELCTSDLGFAGSRGRFAATPAFRHLARPSGETLWRPPGQGVRRRGHGGFLRYPPRPWRPCRGLVEPRQRSRPFRTPRRLLPARRGSDFPPAEMSESRPPEVADFQPANVVDSRAASPPLPEGPLEDPRGPLPWHTAPVRPGRGGPRTPLPWLISGPTRKGPQGGPPKPLS